jgi:hypothetical protein
LTKMATQSRQGLLPGVVKDRAKSVSVPPAAPYRLGEGILIGCDWKLTSDKYNVILWRQEGKTKPRWRAQGFYSTIGNALIGLVSQGVRDSDLTDLRAVQAKIDELRADILRMAAGR